MDSNVNFFKDSKDDLLNQCDPSIAFYGSQSDQNYKNNGEDCDDVASVTNSGSEGGFLDDSDNDSTGESYV